MPPSTSRCGWLQADRHAARFAGLVNAVLRRVAREGKASLAALDMAVLDTPDWLLARWTATYGVETAHAIAAANAREPALDLTVKSDPEFWAAKLNGRVLPTGSVRTIAHGAVTALPGFAEGAWWVQDAAAALPARLLGEVRGRRVADLCAAPGGKTAQLAAAGALRHRGRPRAGAHEAACRKSGAAVAPTPSSSAPTSRNGRRSNNSTPCCSTRRAPRPEPSAAIPTCRGSKAQRTSPSLPACNAA